MADFSLNDDQLQIQSWVHDFAANVIRPAGEEWDEREEFPYPIVEEAAKIGLSDRFRIEDHGRGFDSAAGTSGDGLRNLGERLADLGGECRIESIDGSGTRVHLRLPLPSP